MFDEHGRKIPAAGKAAVHAYSPRFGLVEPKVDYAQVHERIVTRLALKGAPAAGEFAERAERLLKGLQSDAAAANLLRGAHVPFLLAGPLAGDIGEALDARYLPALAASYKAALPRNDFKNTIAGKLAGKVGVAPGSRHDRLIEAAGRGAVVGWYFPMAFVGFSIDAAREQAAGLPERFLLSGGYDAAAALIGTPDLCVNKDAYAPQLDLAGLSSAQAGYAYHFAPYGHDLIFHGRFHQGLASDYCTSGLSVIG